MVDEPAAHASRSPLATAPRRSRWPPDLPSTHSRRFNTLFPTIRSATALLALLAACASLPPQDTPTPEELVASLRHLRDDDPTIETLHVRGHLEAQKFGVKIDLRTELYIRRPHSAALYVFDVRDDTPIIVASEGAGFIYDAMQGVLHWAAPAWPRFRFLAQPKSPGLTDLGFTWGIDHHDRPTLSFSIDLPSIAELAPLDRTVHRLNDQTFRLVSTSPKGSTLTIDFLKDGRYLPTRLEVRPKDPSGFVMRLDTIVVNGEIPPGSFIGLDAAEWAKIAPLTDLHGRDPSEQPLTKLAVITSLALRGVMRDATGSDELPDGTRFDWKKLRQQDARIASQLDRTLTTVRLMADR